MHRLTSDGLLVPRIPIWSLLLAAFIGFGLSLSALADNHQQQELKKLKTSISTLEKKLRNQRKEKNSLQQQLETTERDIRDLNKKNRNIGKKITENERNLSLLKSKKTNLEQRIENQRSTIAQQIQAAYKTGNEEPVKLLLNQENPEQLSRILKYYDYLLEARSKKIDQFTADIASLKITLTKIKSIKASLADSRKELEKDQQKLARNLSKRKTTLNKLSQSLQSNNQQLNQYKKQRDELETLIETVEKAARTIAPAQDYPSFTLSKGKLTDLRENLSLK